MSAPTPSLYLDFLWTGYLDLWKLLNTNLSINFFLIWGDGMDIKSVDLNRLPFISPAKMGLFGINKELQFGVCNHGELPASTQHKKERKTLLKRGRGSGGLWLFIGWAITVSHRLSFSQAREAVFLLPVGLCCPLRAWEFRLLVVWLYFNCSFCLLILKIVIMKDNLIC